MLQVSASHDDAGGWYNPNGYYHMWELEKNHLSIGAFSNGTKYNGGVRFTNVQIPHGATILSAVLKLCCYSTCDGTGARWNVYGQNAGDCAEFSSIEDFDARPRTVAMVDTGFLPPWVAGVWYNSPDLSAIVQEIVNNAGWQAGNALAILIYGHPEGRTTHEIKSYDAFPTESVKLEVVYEGGGGFTLTVESSPIPVNVKLDGTLIPDQKTPIYLSVEGEHIIEVPQEVITYCQRVV